MDIYKTGIVWAMPVRVPPLPNPMGISWGLQGSPKRLVQSTFLFILDLFSRPRVQVTLLIINLSDAFCHMGTCPLETGLKPLNSHQRVIVFGNDKWSWMAADDFEVEGSLCHYPSPEPGSLSLCHLLWSSASLISSHWAFVTVLKWMEIIN